MNVDFPIYQNPLKKQVGVRLICLVKDLSDLRPHRLNPFETISLAKHSPRLRQALESFCQAIQKQRYQNFLSKKLSKLIGKQSPRCRGKHFASPQQA